MGTFIGEIVFAPDAPAYSISGPGKLVSLTVQGAGVMNNSGVDADL